MNLLCVVCLLGAMGLATSARAAVLYAATSAGGPGELYVLDQASGAALQDVGPLNDASSVNYPISGLAFNPFTGVLYGSTGNSVPATGATLVTINPSNALVSVVGPFNVGNAGKPCTMADLAFDPVTGILYGVGTVGGPQLYSINRSTGQATVVGTTGMTSTTGGGLAISSARVFYGTPTAASYGTYSSTTGAFTPIANPVKPLGGGYAALAFDERNVLYGLNSGAGTPPPTELVTIDPPTGMVTALGESVTSLDAIAFQLPPKLIITRSANQIRLQWPGLPAYNVEYKTNLLNGAWLPITTTPASSGGTNSLTLSATNKAAFFRLHKV